MRAFLLLGLILAVPASADPAPAPASPVKPGTRSGEFVIATSGVKDGVIPMPVPFGNIVTARSGDRYFGTTFNKDATEIQLLAGENPPAEITLETAGESIQFPDGVIVLSALDAEVRGETAKLESHPGNHRIGFWSNPEDTVAWKYKATRPGRYQIEVTYSLASPGSKIEVAVGGEKVVADLATTGSWYQYTTVVADPVYIPKSGPLQVTVTPLEAKGAVMNLKALVLRPVSEGDPVVQQAGEAVELDSSAATVHGVKMRYEPEPNKTLPRILDESRRLGLPGISRSRPPEIPNRTHPGMRQGPGRE